MGKVKLTQEQAEAIKEIKSKGMPCRWLSDGWHIERDERLAKVNLNDFIKSIYIGYEVEPEIKVGDFVDIGLFGISKVAEVTGVKGKLIAINGSDEYHEFKINRVLTDEEKQEEKQRRWWAKHGRKVWELRKGDVISDDDGEFHEVSNNNENEDGVSTMSGGFNQKYLEKYSRVICFAEDRKDV